MVLTVAGPPTHTPLHVAVEQLEFRALLATYLHTLRWERARQADEWDRLATSVSAQAILTPPHDETRAGHLRDLLADLSGRANRLREPVFGDSAPTIDESDPFWAARRLPGV